MTKNTKTKKGNGKHVLLAGTNKKSIGRYIAKALHDDGWEIWLYSRNAEHKDSERWHERAYDISIEKQVQDLVAEMPRVDACVFLADSGAHEVLENLTEDTLKNFVNAKIVGSLLLCKELLKRAKSQGKIKLAWSVGKAGEKPKDVIAYAAINAALDNYIKELNRHYSEYFDAFYMPTTLISPSVLGDEYIENKKMRGEDIQHMAEAPQTVLNMVRKIVDGNISVAATLLDDTKIL